MSSKQEYLSSAERSKLKGVFEKYEEVFDGKLGCYPHKKIYLKLMPDARPFCKKAYSVAQQNEHLFKNELKHLCKDGVLERCGPSEWGSPMLITKKKDG